MSSGEDRFHVFKEEIERFMASKADQHLFKKIVAAEGFVPRSKNMTNDDMTSSIVLMSVNRT